MSYKTISTKKIQNGFVRDTIQKKVFGVLSDRQWHCRPCDFRSIRTDQVAGGGGIQGLERGTKRRPGLEIRSKRKHCQKCKKSTRHDRWTGRARLNAVSGDLPAELKKRVATLNGLKDPLTGTTLAAANAIVDHRFARTRWGTDYQPPTDSSASNQDLMNHYQILRCTKDNNENLRKSRACEVCKNTRIRQSPLNHLKFFYDGDRNWPSSVPDEGEAAMKGCIGCGWYDVDQWLNKLNQIAAIVSGRIRRTGKGIKALRKITGLSQKKFGSWKATTARLQKGKGMGEKSKKAKPKLKKAPKGRRSPQSDVLKV